MHRIAPVVPAVLVAGVVAGCGGGSGAGGDGRAAGPASGAPRDGAAAATGPASGARREASAARASVLVGAAESLVGDRVPLSRYRGRVVLVVNTASECVNTPQYGELERLYKRDRPRGLVVLGFPSGDFGDQELDSSAAIKSFCTENFGVTFPMFAKTHVTGDSAHPLYRRLIAAAGAPNWNFGKYLLDRRGRVVQRFDAYLSPLAGEVTRAIDRQLRD